MKSILAVLLVLGTMATGLAVADLKTETLTRTSLLTGIGTTEAKSVNEYQGDKRADNQTFKIVGGIVGALAGKPQSKVAVTRLDKDVIWDLNPANKTCTERPIAFPTEQELKGETKQSGPGQRPPYRVVKSELKVTKTGAAKEINGFACQEYLLTWEVVLEDTASKGQVTQLMTVDMWNTPLTDKLQQARAIEAEFNRKLALKMGVELFPDEMQRLGLGMLTAMYGLDSKETAEKLAQVGIELSKIEGHSIVTEVKWQVKPDSTAPKKPEPEPQPSGSLGGLLANKLAQKIAPEKPKSEEGVIFTSYLEVKSVSLDAVPDPDFEIPAGYKKTEK